MLVNPTSADLRTARRTPMTATLELLLIWIPFRNGISPLDI